MRYFPEPAAAALALCLLCCGSLFSQPVSKETGPAVPAVPESPGSGAYTGFNSLDLQEIYAVRKQRAVRSLIARGWGKPIIIRFQDGTLVASQAKFLRFDRNPRYPEAVEEAALVESTDEGRTWSQPRLLGIPGRVTQLTLLATGTMILAVENGIYRSVDRGRTWSRSLHDAGWILGETNGVVELKNGEVACGVYKEIAPGRSRTYLLRSSDDGKSWGDESFVAEASEVSYVNLPQGKLMGFARVARRGLGEGGASLAIVESRDGGRRWTAPRDFGLGPAQIPGFPVFLPDGRLVLVVGNRQFPFGAQAIASRDQGRTWSLAEPILLAWFSWDNYCGHPRSILMPDGSIMTGYYTRMYKGGRTPNEDIVSQALRWTPPAEWPSPDRPAMTQSPKARRWTSNRD